MAYKDPEPNFDSLNKKIEESAAKYAKAGKAAESAGKKAKKAGDEGAAAAQKATKEASKNEVKIKYLEKSLNSIKDAIKGIAAANKQLSSQTTKTINGFEKQIKTIREAMTLYSEARKVRTKEFRIADSTLTKLDDQLSARQVSLLDKKLVQLGEGKISMGKFTKDSKDISKDYYNLLKKRLSNASITTEEIKASEASNRNKNRDAKANAVIAATEQKAADAHELAAQKIKEEVEAYTEKYESLKKVNREKEKTASTNTETAEAKRNKAQADELNSRIKAARNYAKGKEEEEARDAKALRRQQKLAENERARATLYQQLGQIMTGSYDDTSKATQKAELASKRLLETMRHIQEFAATKGFTGTVGLESTDVLRAQQYYNTIMQLAIEWKRNNSEEGKAADMLGRMLVDLEGFRGGVNRIHTAMGQVASTFSAVAGIAKQFRQTITRLLQPITQMVTRLSSSAFRSSLEALKNIELSEIGFGNFFGEFAVPGIMSNIKQNALLSPLSAAQLASYVNQIAPLSNGNSTLATNAAMGVAKMIQYSGGEVTTEMEYVIRNLRDVISKGKATSIDIRQFNRAMPALKKVLQDMGLEDFLKNGELTVSKETAPKLLEAFQKINESEDVGSIFDKTSVTISGLMERMQEQIELLVIDVADFAGATDWIKNTLHDILEDENGWLTNVKTFLSFVGNDVMRWVKSRDWERFAQTLGEIFDIFKSGISEGFAAIREALGGVDFATTLKQFAQIFSEFIKGIANSYGWLINIVKGMSNSGFLGSGVLQAGMGIMGFLSGNAGTLITGLTRAFGNFMGVFNQTITSAINVLKGWQAKLLEAATTVNGFDEAIVLASKASADLAADFALMQQMMNGSMSQEQVKQAMMEIEARSRDRLIEAQIRNTASEEAETAANERAAASELAEAGANGAAAGATGAAASGGIFATLFGKGSGLGTKLGSILGTLGKGLLGALLAGGIGNAVGSGITSALGGDKYVSSGVGSSIGNIGGGAIAGATIGSIIPGIGTGIGAIVGAVGGLVKQVFDIHGILEEKRKDELEAVEAQVNSGEYVRQLLEKTQAGQRVVSGDFDRINSAAVKLMHQFNETFPNGTADALLTFLAETAFNGQTLNEMVAASNRDREQNADLLWDAIKNETIDEETGEFLANEFAATLYDAGYDNGDITSMVLQKAVADGLDASEIANIMTRWSSVQTTAGEDLPTSELLKLKDSEDPSDQIKYQNYVTQLKTLFGTVMGNVIKDADLSDEEKTALSQQMAQTWVDILTESLNTDDKEGIFSLTRLFQEAGVNAKNNPFNLGITDDDVTALDDYKIELYGINRNWDTWSKKLYLFGEGITWYSDKISKRIADFNGVVDPAVEKINSLRNSIDNLKDSANNATNALDPFSNPFDKNNPFAPTNTFNKANGGLIYRASGGNVRGVDTVPAMLQSGEYVVRRSAVNKIGLSAMNALNTGNLGYFARAMGRQDIYGDYNNARTWNNTNNDNRKSVSNVIKVYNNSRGARLNRYYSLANRLA